MVSTEEADDQLFKKHQNLVGNLKLDDATSMQAWDSYQKIKTKFTLEGDQLHWLGCAIFVACREQTTTTLSGSLLEGNCVSLTSLLRNYDLSLQHFFDKIHKWVNMAELSDDFRKKIKALEKTFSVSCNIFRKYIPMFSKVFKAPNDVDVTNKHRNRKQNKPPCTPTQLFEFNWLLFVTVKGEDPTFSEDLVPSSHLLQSCCDLMFKNAFLDDRRDLINPSFEGLPGNWSSRDYIIHTEAPCIIDNLCEPEMLTDAKYMKIYTFIDYMQKLFKKAHLLGDVPAFTGLLNPNNFEQNYKNLTKVYEAQLLQKGGFDERIFLAEYRRRLIIKDALQSTNGNSQSALNESAESDFKRSQSEVSRNTFNTPLTNRQYLGPREPNESGALIESQTVAKLQLLVNGRNGGPSEVLLDIFKNCSTNPQTKIQLVLDALSTKFCTALEEDSEHVAQKVQLATQLFYRFLESILADEQRRQSDIEKLVSKECFYECLYTCALEIVNKSYNMNRPFPWILQALDVRAFYFIRVIELIVRSKLFSLPRETVKHLNRIEEIILDSEIWKTESILWDELKKDGVEIPRYEEIGLPGNMIYGQKSRINDTNDKPRDILASPGPSAVDTFDSPINQVKKQLFPIKPGQSLLSHNQKNVPLQLMFTDPGGCKKIVPLVTTTTTEAGTVDIHITTPTPTTQASSEVVITTPQKPHKTGGFNIIFRKVYNLAVMRLRNLCTNLEINDEELKFKIWTAFEHCLRNLTADLFRDRHLDQVLMCSIYVICKVTDNEKNFSQIMASYKQQPQATSYIYRNVLLYRAGEKDDKGQILTEDKRDNLIQFYNFIFVKPMTSFAIKFSSKSSQNSHIKLSPMPSIKSLLASPVLEVTRNFYIKKPDSPGSITPTSKAYNYFFNRSASKDLKDINRAINNNGMTKKRVLTDNSFFDLESSSKRLCSNRKVQTLLEERRNQVSD